MLPNFLYIGPDKSGSSWLHSMLLSHPDAWVPSFKDVYFFDRYYDKGIEWYERLFDECPANIKAVGEISHDYLFSAVAARRIAQHLEGVRLLTILRDPVDRSFSQYLYLVRSGRTNLAFRDALDACPELVENSLYNKHLSEYFDIFTRDQLGIFWFDDLQRNPEVFADEICRFLHIGVDLGIQVKTKVRPASRARSALLAKLAKRGATMIRDLGMPRLVGAIKHGPVATLLYEQYESDNRPQIQEEDAYFLRQQLSADILALQELLDVDLSVWLTNGADRQA